MHHRNYEDIENMDRSKERKRLQFGAGILGGRTVDPRDRLPVGQALKPNVVVLDVVLSICLRRRR